MTKAERAALMAADLALTDWVRMYAPEHCDTRHVFESGKRVSEAGGTLAYIAKVRKQIKEALNEQKLPPR